MTGRSDEARDGSAPVQARPGAQRIGGATGSDDVTRVDGDSRSVRAPRAPGDPTHIGRYLVIRRLGEGGMGAVYSAYDDDLDRRVAIKLLHRADDPGAQTRLLREAQALARLSHPNVVQIYEVGQLDDQVYLVMEQVPGQTLRSYIADPRHGWRQRLEVFRQAGQGLAAAHAAGLVHRDFKPDNVLVGADGRVRVLDFGLARMQAGALETASTSASGFADDTEPTPRSGRDPAPTEAGALLGTPAYMSPEQIMRTPADARADQFSFCVALWEALAGARPFAGSTWGERIARIRQGPTRPQRRDVPGSVFVALARGLSLAPESRFPDMPALLAALSDDPRHLETGSSLAALADALVQTGALARAEAAAGRAIDILSRFPDARSELGWARFSLARARWRSPGARREAAALLDRAEAELRDSPELGRSALDELLAFRAAVGRR